MGRLDTGLNYAHHIHQMALLVLFVHSFLWKKTHNSRHTWWYEMMLMMGILCSFTLNTQIVFVILGLMPLVTVLAVCSGWYCESRLSHNLRPSRGEAVLQKSGDKAVSLLSLSVFIYTYIYIYTCFYTFIHTVLCDIDIKCLSRRSFPVSGRNHVFP